MAEGKKIVFEGIDGGAFNMVDKLNSKTTDMYNKIVEGTKRSGQSAKEHLKLIEETIKAYERLTKATLDSQKAQGHLKREDLQDFVSTRQGLQEHLLKSKGIDVGLVSGLSKSLIAPQQQQQPIDLKKAQDIIASLSGEGASKSRQSFISQLTSRYFDKPESVTSKQIEKFTGVLKSSDSNLSTEALNEKLIQKIQELKETQLLIHKETTEHHLKDDEKDKKPIVAVVDAGGKIAAVSSEKESLIKTIEKTSEQVLNERLEIERTGGGEHASGAHKGGSHKGGAHGESFWDAITSEIPVVGQVAAGASAGVIGAELLMKAFDYIKDLAIHTEMLHTQAISPEEMAIEHEKTMASMGGLNPLAEITAARKHRYYQESEKVQQQQFRFYATTGGGANINDEKASDLGITNAESIALSEQISKARGRRATESETYGAQFATKVLGVEMSNVMGLEKQSRFSTSKQGSKEYIAEVAASLGLENDRTKLNESLQALVSLGQSHLGILSKIDQRGMLDMVARFKENKSPLFQNMETLMPIIGAFDEGLAKPKNDFAKAQRFSELTRENPNASYFEIMRKMSHGAGEKNALSNSLKGLEERYGGDKEMMKTALLNENQFGLTPDQIDDFVEGYVQNREQFTGMSFTGTGDLSKVRSGKSFISQGEKAIQDQKVINKFRGAAKAKISNAFAFDQTGRYGTDEAEKQAKLFEEGPEKKPLTQAQMQAFGSAVQILVPKTKQLADSLENPTLNLGKFNEELLKATKSWNALNKATTGIKKK